MNISRERLIRESRDTGFRTDVLEKVIHLLNLLEGFNRHPFLKNRLALKGGTALNLFLFDTPRLSVDIDLNYIGAADLDTMTTERPKVEQAIQAVCSREGMTVHRVPADHAGGKWQLRYASALGAGGNLEVDLNFMYRIPLWKVTRRNANVGSFSAKQIPVLDLHELAAGKLAALFSRQASRDLFDAHQLLTHGSLDPTKLRLGFVLYGAMNRKDWRSATIADIGHDRRELEYELIPLLRTQPQKQRTSDVWFEQMITECRDRLGAVLPMMPNELTFLNRILDYGEIEPEWLTADNEMAERIRLHPLLQWKALNVRNHKKRE